MPNWIEGSLKIRGNGKDIKKFFEKGLIAYKRNKDSHDLILVEMNKNEWIQKFYDDNEDYVEFSIKNRINPFIVNTQNAYLQSTYIILTV